MKLFPSELAAIREVSARARDRLPFVNAVSVFGSRARGGSLPGSDLDVAIHIDAERDPELSRHVAEVIGDLFAEYGFLSISTVYDKGADPLRDAIASEEVAQWTRS